MDGRDVASTWKSPLCPQHNGFGLDSRPEQELVAVVKNQEHAKDAKKCLFFSPNGTPRSENQTWIQIYGPVSTRLAGGGETKKYKMDEEKTN